MINQRPDLFRVAIPQVGVMDMLRFHKFTIGWNWIADYGSSDNAEEFKASTPIRRCTTSRPAQKYPATLITTADHDDRVVPAHSFKYAATLQKAASKDNPVLIRIETKSGHGASNVTKQIEATADIYAFIMHNMGIRAARRHGVSARARARLAARGTRASRSWESLASARSRDSGLVPLAVRPRSS